MDRLTTRKYGEIVSSKREKKEIHCSNFCNNCSQGSGNCEYVKDMIEKLAEYEELEEKGLVLKLPCKLGDTLHWFDGFGNYQQSIVNCIYIENGLDDIKIETLICTLDASELNKTVFLTREEAEKALKEMECAE